MYIVAVFVFAFASAASAQRAAIDPADLKALEGGEWEGNLTYLDYSSNQKTTIKSNLKVSPAGTDGRAWRFEYVYPLEPKANSASDVKLSADGGTFNDQKVVERTKNADGTLKIVTTKAGTDNDKKAEFRFTYLIGPGKFSVMKEVRVEGSDSFFERNTYSWNR